MNFLGDAALAVLLLGLMLTIAIVVGCLAGIAALWVFM